MKTCTRTAKFYLLPSITLLSAAALGYEILLMRLFSIIQWHHFAYMIISLALLGYGASGVFLALGGRGLSRHFTIVYTINTALSGLAMPACFAIAQNIPFNPLEIIWAPRQLLYLSSIYLFLSVPFFCAANAIGLAFIHHRGWINRIYRADLVGAGMGALAIVLVLFVAPPSRCLVLLCTVSLAAAGLALLGRESAVSRWSAMALMASALIVPTVWPQGWQVLRITPYKGLSQALQVVGAEVDEERSSPLGLLTVVRSPLIPFRYAPGLSLLSTVEPPPQLGVFTDGDALSTITHYDGRREPLAYLDAMPSALAYHLLQQPRVLILGAGGGADVLQARYHRAAAIDAVEINPRFIDLVRRDYAEFAGDLYSSPDVRVHLAEARGFVASHRGHYDLIQLALLDSFSASSAGVHALSENYLYTIEAIQSFIEHLAPGGVLSITRWLKVPPRDSLKLFATAVAALERTGVEDAERRLVLIRGWNTATLVIKNGVLSGGDIAAVRRFCRERAFDTAFYPGMTSRQANRFNVLDEPYFFNGAQALLGPERDGFLARYKFNILPATDDRPYFFDFFKLRAVPEIVTLRGQGGLPLLEWGYLIQCATLVQAVMISLALILLPLWLARRKKREIGRSGLRMGGYFLAIGLGFLFIEIAFIQKFILFLSHPLYAIAVVLSGFLIFAGLGSGCSARLSERCRTLPVSPVAVAVGAITVIALIYIVVLAPVFHRSMPLPDSARIILSLALIAPLAFVMGMPFPLGLAHVAVQAPDFIPWAWGINGCASVVSAILAGILAIQFGFTAVVIAAVMLYGVAAALSPSRGSTARP